MQGRDIEGRVSQTEGARGGGTTSFDIGLDGSLADTTRQNLVDRLGQELGNAVSGSEVAQA